ncbi:unnamed protein product, partial [Prorocentrum cordatum]
MGRKKILAGSQAQEAFELKPFCYYCDRDFDSVKTLVQHQRTKHFKCAECGLSFDTVTGLRVHMLNAYKRTMKEVPNATTGRENPDIVVHGMEGIPKRVLEERTRGAMAERAEKDKIREEETKERNKSRAAEEASSKPAAQRKPPAPEAPEPPAQGSAPPLPPPDPPAPRPRRRAGRRRASAPGWRRAAGAEAAPAGGRAAGQRAGPAGAGGAPRARGPAPRGAAGAGQRRGAAAAEARGRPRPGPGGLCRRPERRSQEGGG